MARLTANPASAQQIQTWKEEVRPNKHFHGDVSKREGRKIKHVFMEISIFEEKKIKEGLNLDAFI